MIPKNAKIWTAEALVQPVFPPSGRLAGCSEGEGTYRQTRKDFNKWKLVNQLKFWEADQVPRSLPTFEEGNHSISPVEGG
jgi:hypothetical protein